VRESVVPVFAAVLSCHVPSVFFFGRECVIVVAVVVVILVVLVLCVVLVLVLLLSCC